ncbi:MAG: hypothetical protein K2X47_19795 [Bdellovibrionales bacterium]|nr:hypothetical protein [Bdellovibrionales bacterium]
MEITFQVSHVPLTMQTRPDLGPSEQDQFPPSSKVLQFLPLFPEIPYVKQKTYMSFLLSPISIVLLLTLLACARGELPESETLRSRSIWYTTTTTGTGTTIPTWSGGGGAEPLLHCSPFNQQQINFSGHIASLSTSSGTLDPNRVGMIVKGYPAEFLNSDDTFIQIFRWRAPTSGSTAITDNTPLLLTLYHLPSGREAAINLGRDIKFDKAAITRAASRINVEYKPYDFAIIVNGTPEEWQALMIAVYKGTNNLGYAQALLPGFLANPNTYATYRPALLSNIHPLRSKAAEAWSSNDFRIAGEALCSAPETMTAIKLKTRYIASSEGRDADIATEPPTPRDITQMPSQMDPWLIALTFALLLGVIFSLLKRKKTEA